jgi:beta-galactosidase
LGDRSGGGINPLVIFSNCDEIEVYFGDRSLGLFQPDRAAYPNLPHPPLIIDCFGMYSTWGKREFHDLKVLGYINGEIVCEHIVWPATK